MNPRLLQEKLAALKAAVRSDARLDVLDVFIRIHAGACLAVTLNDRLTSRTATGWNVRR